MNLRPAIAALTIVTSLAAAATASAHARLVSSNPPANAAVAPPKAISLTFSEKLTPAFSGFDLAMSDGMNSAVKTHVSPDGKTLVGAPQGPLMAGAYVVKWHAVTADDGHKVTGTLSFTVK